MAGQLGLCRLGAFMPIQIQGNGGVVADVDGTTFRALRVAPARLSTDH